MANANVPAAPKSAHANAHAVPIAEIKNAAKKETVAKTENVPWNVALTQTLLVAVWPKIKDALVLVHVVPIALIKTAAKKENVAKGENVPWNVALTQTLLVAVWPKNVVNKLIFCLILFYNFKNTH